MSATRASSAATLAAPRAHLTRRYHLSASHRLCSDAYSDEQNRAIYGKCSNPYGHGHNYIAAVTFAGPVSPATGMVCNLAALDAFAQTNLLAVFDHSNLNTLDAFRDRVPTTENFTLEIARIFSQFPGAHLVRVRVEETGNNSFEYSPQSGLTKG
jgi:6-pyruvoyltetrahydropterin/6-carboxytetrahydropterin synthase